MRKLEGQEPLASELAGWEEVVVDVGRFDRHEALLAHFGVDRIAWWAALRPTDCGRPVVEWEVLKTGVFEPESGSGPKTADAVAGWLVAAREGR